mmetsp:Transcript_5122/g.8956  ORF Transcript_5122/g.8956 Transcript_5122/m.8956 type:complete len:190 (-) Transcript_5122:1942-2511(-)
MGSKEALERGLKIFNGMGESESRMSVKACCSSGAFVEKVVASKPFGNVDELNLRSSTIWFQELKREDWMEAISAHPRIGEQKIAASKQGASALDKKLFSDWSKTEQASILNAEQDVKADLAQSNTEYYEKFGFIFLIFATGKTSQEMLATIKARLQNAQSEELINAAHEQNKITLHRMQKLLLSLASAP